jgi:hypothetical protein
MAFLAACGGKITGTAAAPPGTTVHIFTPQDADEIARRVSAHNKPLHQAFEHLQLGASERAQRIMDSLAHAPPMPPGRAINELGSGTVGVGGALAIDGHYRGHVALVIDSYNSDRLGCRVDLDMPFYGERNATMAGDQCRLWLPLVDREELSRTASMRWQEDSLAGAGRARTEAAARALAAQVLTWPFVVDRDSVYYFTAKSPCAMKIPAGRRTFLRDSAYAHQMGYGRSSEPGC